MTSFIFWLVLWAVTAPITYILVRRDYRGSFGKWTQIDRVYWACFCLLYGPIMLLVVIFIGLAMKVSSTDWAKGEARW